MITNNTSHIFWRRCFLIRIQAGFNHILKNKKYMCFLLVLICLAFKIWLSVAGKIFDRNDFLDNVNFVFYSIILFLFLVIGILWFRGKPFLAFKVQDALRRAGLHNSAGEPPIFLNITNISDRIFQMEFRCDGIPLDVWFSRIGELESAMNISISEITLGQDMQKVQIIASKGKFDYHKEIKWKNSYLSQNTSFILLGESIARQIEMSLDVYPHILIGGGTGSGKTWLLKLILMQCVKKGYLVYIADFKGGVDYTSAWKRKCEFVDTTKELVRILNDIVSELEHRKRIFAEKECNHINSYNKYAKHKLPRIIFACDEVAELLDSTGLDKAEKEQVREISRMLSTIARLGRAFGIHLVLATQRPDADIMPGQIKNNISYRICGRADSVLSKIILDNTDAATKIPTDIPGIFMNQDGTIFKGYMFDEETCFSLL